MAIKKILKIDDNPIFLNLFEGDALISFEIDKTFHAIYLNKPTSNELEKLSRFNTALNLKFVGCQDIFKKIDNLRFQWCKFNSKSFTNSYPAEVLIHLGTGKIQVAKDKTNTVAAKKRVLIVDDSKPIHKVLGKIISNSQLLEVMGNAYCPSEARNLIEKDRPDLITLDINMPEMTGLEFLKTYLGALNIPTVVISSESVHDSDVIIEALSNGADTFIEKPSFDQLPVLSVDILEKLETIAFSKKILLKTISDLKF